MGTTFENISFEFKDGKIIKAVSNNTDILNKILDTDEGARYIGEFSLGLNPYIEQPMKNTLFDEKIKGSLHFTPGSCYDECDNGNKSLYTGILCLYRGPNTAAVKSGSTMYLLERTEYLSMKN
jgi:aminopeptidase